jgi:hypothetical protein
MQTRAASPTTGIVAHGVGAPGSDLRACPDRRQGASGMQPRRWGSGVRPPVRFVHRVM